MKNILKRQRKNWVNILLVGLLTAVSSEIYFSILVDHFRISPAVVIFPFLLLTVGKRLPMIPAGAGTMAVVFVLRLTLAFLGQEPWGHALRSVFPGAFYYLTYSILFALLIPRRNTASEGRLALAAGDCDFFSNLLELLLRQLISSGGGVGAESVVKIALVALVRGLLLYGLLLLWKQYHFLLKKEEHEQRYRQLFLLTADLKNELYLMKKNSEQIETVMKDAYLLYERSIKDNQSEEVQNTCLNIAREVHDIKKDYYRLIQGIEEELGKNPDEGSCELKDLLRMVTEAANLEIKRRDLPCLVETEMEYPFKTDQHYALMSILMNLVTNSVEAMDGSKKQGMILIQEGREQEEIWFRVKDNGQGIPEKRLANIFDVGYSSKFDPVTGNIYRGVGLPGVKYIVEDQFHGSIEVSSTAGRGTCFTLHLPLKEVIGEKA